MKKFIYLSIVLATLSFTSFRTQDNNQSKEVKTNKKEIKSTNYVKFNSAVSEIGDPARPPQD
jgi:hypothetical protein